MNDATQAKQLFLPDPGEYFMVVIRHASVELSMLLTPSQMDDDEFLTKMVRSLRTVVKSQLDLPKET